MFTGNNNYFTKILVELKKKNLKYWCSHGNPGDPLMTPLLKPSQYKSESQMLCLAIISDALRTRALQMAKGQACSGFCVRA